MLVLISFFVMFVASMFPFLSGFTLESWAQSNSEFESRLIFGNTTAVNDNYTIGINDNLVVSLALIDTKISSNSPRRRNPLYINSMSDSFSCGRVTSN